MEDTLELFPWICFGGYVITRNELIYKGVQFYKFYVQERAFRVWVRIFLGVRGSIYYLIYFRFKFGSVWIVKLGTRKHLEKIRFSFGSGSVISSSSSNSDKISGI